jgi:hypothetical protein
MSWLDDWGVPKIEIVNAKRNALCRGKGCKHSIAIGERVLRIYMPSTRGNYPSFFCKDCMPYLINQMEIVADDFFFGLNKPNEEETTILELISRKNK